MADHDDHVSTFTEDDDGWPIVSCTCGWVSGPVPDTETAADCWGDHYAVAAVDQSMTAARATIADLNRKVDAERERAERAETRLAAIEDGVRRTADIREAHRKGSGYSLYALLDVTDTPGADA